MTRVHSDSATAENDFDRWDPSATQRFVEVTSRLANRWFRPEIRGLQRVPVSGGALLASNHSGGMLTPDVLVIASAFYKAFGYARPLHTLGHDALFVGPISDWMTSIGVIHANRENAAAALKSGGVVLNFPGGIYDAYRPTLAQNVIDFNGRVGYVRTAVAAKVPIVPMVSIGGQESQFFVGRGTWLAKRLRLNQLRSDILPLTFGFPFGLSMVVPVNFPLPTKIVAEVLEPIDIVGQFGAEPDVHEVDSYVRSVMQKALDRLARQRRLPVLG